jgi:DNA-binding FrmR family transcriptional regulator
MSDASPAVVPSEHAACACGTGERRAIHVDPEAKARNTTRLRRIEGQVRGLQKMIDEDRWCADIVTQIASVHEALRGVGRELLRNHLRHCVSAAASAPEVEREAVYEELVELFYAKAR